MNCTGDFRRNDYATFEASCLVYDAVLAGASADDIEGQRNRLADFADGLPEMDDPTSITSPNVVGEIEAVQSGCRGAAAH